MKIKFPLCSLIVIGFLGASYLVFPTLSWASFESIGKTEEDMDESDLEGPPNGQGGWVIVDPLYIVPSTKVTDTNLIPYKYRRSRWGATFSLGYSMYVPENYAPKVFTGTYSDVYNDAADLPLVEAQLEVRRNTFLGSFALVVAAGIYNNESDNDALDSELEILPVRLGLKYTVDSFLDEPYIAPYVEVGGYTIKYSESQGTTSFNGTTQAALYYAGGVLLQLDWLDQRSAKSAFLNGGVENTSLFLEGRQFATSGAVPDPDFGSSIHGNAGIRVEF